MERGLLTSSLLFLLLPQSDTSAGTINSTRPLKDGDVLVSDGGTFALGFFAPNINSTDRYLGIWYNKISVQTVVWVANRDQPIGDISGYLSIEQSGNLVLYDDSRKFLAWSTNVSSSSSNSSDVNNSARLLDSGNLILFQGESRVVWQSFDHPTDTMLPDMKLGFDRDTGLNRVLTSWRSGSDPSTGQFYFKMELSGSPQLFLYQGKTPVWRTGPWTGHGWSGVPPMGTSFIFNVTFVDNSDEAVEQFRMFNTSVFSRLVVNETGRVDRLTWQDDKQEWYMFYSVPKDECDGYNHCGSFGNCNPFNPQVFECDCLPGFEPRSSREWFLRDGSGGCVRKAGAQVCRNGEGFAKLAGTKVPDTTTALVNKGLELKACEEWCLGNCSCLGYAVADVVTGVGCITWYQEMMDTRQFSDGGQDLYVRVDAAVLAQISKKSKGFRGRLVIGIVAPLAATVLFVLAFAFCMRKTRAKRRYLERLSNIPMSDDGFSTGKEIHGSGTNADTYLFDLSEILAATENFLAANKIGEGGFGSVYKGRLSNGQEIAVKRLSDNSGQGDEEFRNEVTLIAKLQHRNLVKLLGCCNQKVEKMLIYEYLPNKGLDFFLFDKEKCLLLDWKKRVEIVLGVARGMLYLHQDSRLRIVHRDLKASNVLLDSNLNPKISDFGMARIFGGDQLEAQTRRVVGTYGYMAPEYAMEGLFSTKSDVFSFGVLLLEIISGRKNGSYYLEATVNLIGYVWELWGEGKALEIVDPTLGMSYESHEAHRFIHVALLCLQETPGDRPTMSEVTFMLSNETNILPPRQPAFVFRRLRNEETSKSTSAGAVSVCEEMITAVEAR